ncbi:MAG: hypothetical protein RIQ41_343 [Candidatus Parcubacteria bacterium]|jgi:hypothetical protein
MTIGTKILLGILILGALGGGGYYYSTYTKSADALGTTLIINNEPVTLVNGIAVKEDAPGSASKTTTQYFGNEVTGDFNNDGKKDTAFIVTQTTGGSGTFFYLTTTLGGEAAFLGDRIAPQSTDYKDGKIVVNFAERKAGEPMTAEPSVGVSKYFEVGPNGTLVEISNKQEATTSTIGKKMAFFDFAKQGGTYLCSVDQEVNGVRVKTTMYLDKGKMRGETSLSGPTGPMTATFVIRDGYVYYWASIMPKDTGIKLKYDATNYKPGDFSQFDQMGDYTCEGWVADPTKFIIPTTITFQAMN